MFSRIFIKRPRLAVVVSIIITLAGLLAMFNIPVAQYPQITPPEIVVTAFYPGASAQVLGDSVGAPIEAEINGVDNMLYMSSLCSNDGAYSLSVTFEVGTDPDMAQVNTQNRVQLAIPKLPEEVTRQGIDVRKQPPNMLATISFLSPGGSYDRLYLSNYIDKNIKDNLVRLKGVSDIFVFGELEYSMRIWMNPGRLTAFKLTADDVITAIRQQNVQAAVGSIGTAPVAVNQQIQYNLQARGRLKDIEDFKNIIIRANPMGGLVRIRDVARVELGAKTYGHESILNGAPAVTFGIYSTTGSNAIDTMDGIRAELENVSQHLPEDVAYKIVFDSTEYVLAAIHEIKLTLFITFFLVVGMTYLFLQNWRATLIPTLTIPVSLVGTFAVLLLLGFSANTISLFALVMSVGLVVDDAIIVVENVYRVMEKRNLDPPKAAAVAMDQVTGPIIATTLVLMAIFVPIGFLPGITGELYKQFAVTISTAVIISAINSLTLSPALCAVLLRPHEDIRKGPFNWFNKTLESSRDIYVSGSTWLIKRKFFALLMILAIFGTTYYLFINRPTSFLPNEDQGVFYMNVQLPESASLPRTCEVLRQITKELKNIKGIDDVFGVGGFSLLSGNADNVGFGLGILTPWDKRTSPDLHVNAILAQVQQKLAAVSSANSFAFTPPPINGLGYVGGFDFRLQAINDQSPLEIAAVTRAIIIAANQNPVLTRVFSTYNANTPKIFVDLDRTRAETLKVSADKVFSTLQAQLGAKYVNDFNLSGRVYQVKVQADRSHRDSIGDINRLYVRSTEGNMVPMTSLVSLSTVLSPAFVSRYNQFTSAQITGGTNPGYSPKDAIEAMKQVADETLPDGYSYDWSGVSFQTQKTTGNILFLFGFALLFAYLFLVGQYESWNIPLAIIISIPVAIMGGLTALWWAGLNLSIYAQIGLVLLVGLASKNAILIVEFAQERRKQGLSVADAAVEGARIRFRPVLMTTFTFMLGLAPMVIATGAGSNSRRHIGTTVFFGMLASVLIGIFFIPVSYYVFQTLREKGAAWRTGRR